MLMLVPLAVVLAYLLGSVNGALLLGQLRGGVDIRKLGSGNAGGTNALRTQGPLFALGVVLIDLSKGWIAAVWLPVLLARMFGESPAALEASALPAACAFAAVLGHVYPVFYGFRGGKGAATVAGAVLALSPASALVLVCVWLTMIVLFGYVGLATIVAAIALPLAVWALGARPEAPMLVFALLVAALVVFTHRGNLLRLRAGTEPRARRLWLVGRLRHR